MKTPAKGVIPQICLEARSTIPLQRQLYQALRRIIQHGRLELGVRLPPTRQLARELGVSRNTVLFAYEELAADALITGTTGCGTRVDRTPPEFSLVDPDGHVIRCMSQGQFANIAILCK